MSELPLTLLDRLIAFEDRNQRVITVLLALWFWVGVAVYANFLDLPDIPMIDEEQIFFWASAAFNAVWWGFARPSIARRKALLEKEQPRIGQED